jgi:hypothetical protein
MRSILIPVLLLASTGAFAQTPKPQTTLPVYHCKKIDRDLKVTGKADDTLWKQAETATLQQHLSGGPTTQATTMRLLYNDRILYVAFHAEDTYIKATRVNRDDSIWKDDCLELFISPAGTRHQYYEINCNPLNTVFDACLLNSRTRYGDTGPIKWLSAFNVKDLVLMAYVEGEKNKQGAGKYWRTEYAIPLSEMWGATNIPPKKGDMWLMNAFRTDSPAEGKFEGSAWSPIAISAPHDSYHHAARFGMLVFE